MLNPTLFRLGKLNSKKTKEGKINKDISEPIQDIPNKKEEQHPTSPKDGENRSKGFDGSSTASVEIDGRFTPPLSQIFSNNHISQSTNTIDKSPRQTIPPAHVGSLLSLVLHMARSAHATTASFTNMDPHATYFPRGRLPTKLVSTKSITKHNPFYVLLYFNASDTAPSPTYTATH